MELTQDGKFYVDEWGEKYSRVSSVCKMAEYVDDGLIYAGASMVAKRVPELVECALQKRPFPRPTMVGDEPAIIQQDLREWPGMAGWLAGCPAAEMEKARNRGMIGDLLAVRFAEEGWLPIKDAKQWAVQTGYDMLLSFDEDDVASRAGVFSAWWAKVNPKPIAWQFTVSGNGWAGTMDMLAEIDGSYYTLDWKFGKYSWVYKMQVCTYRSAPNVHLEDKTADAVLQVKSNSTPALVVISDNRVQFRPVENALYWCGVFDHFHEVYTAASRKEDSPTSRKLSYTPDDFEKAMIGL